MAVWYCRDNSTVSTNTLALVPGSVGWSAMTGWTTGASIAPGTLRRQSAGQAVFTASQTTTTLTVTAVTSGTIYVGMICDPTAAGLTTTITALGTGVGGTGTYTMAFSQSVASTTYNGGLAPANTRAFVAVQAATGTTGATDPAWVVTKGAKTTDNTVTWMECTGLPAVNGDLTNTQNWTAVKNTAVALGRIITDNAGTHIFIVTTAGTVGNGSEPTWTTAAVGNTTADNTVTWTYIGTSYSAWAAPHAYVDNVFTTTWGAAGDTAYLGDDHSEVQQAAALVQVALKGTYANPNFIYSIDHTLSLPVSSSGLKTGATIASQLSALGIQSASVQFGYWYGVTFSCGTGATLSSLNLAQTGGMIICDTCVLKVNNTNAASGIAFGLSAASSQKFINTTMSFAAAGQTVVNNGTTIWRNTASAITGTTPTILLNATGSGTLVIEGVDLSALASGKTISPAGTSGADNLLLYLIDCKLGSSVTIASTPVNPAGPFVDAVRCSSSSSTYIQRRYLYEGTLSEETTIIRTSGASDGTTGISWNLTTTANSKWILPLESFPISIWNGITGTNRVVTLYGIWNSASLPNNDDVWIDVAYLGASGSPQASWQSNTKATNLTTASALSADSSSAWDSLATARANTTAYSLGNVIKLASNPNRIFFCTTAGTTAGSEPGGYASAVDGGSVTDNTAVFRVGQRFVLTTTLNTPQPQLAGYLRVYVKAAKVSSTFYVDPLVTLS